MKKSFLSLKGVKTLSKKEQVTIQGTHGGPSAGSGHPPICGVLGFPPCMEK